MYVYIFIRNARYIIIWVFFLLVAKRGHEVLELLKETKEKVKHGTRMYY